jgi:sugar lactone lactonase YvrE
VPKAVEKFMPGRFTLDYSGNLYVIDRLNKRIVVVDKDGNFIKSITARGKGFYGFNDVRVDDRGYVYGVDTVGATVYIYSDKGKLVNSFGGASSGLVFPVSVAISSKGLIYVAERYLSQIMVFDASGTLQYTLLSKGVTSGEVYHPSYVYIDKSDRIYTVDGSRVQVFKEKR